ncbi:MAG: YdcF family protein [Holosporaceae bacterium]|jgi:uncharacterized SAM-binding protein YcdF (DUF218 family)|nr:YdcF family protein [Holosporaceae bacterium]
MKKIWRILAVMLASWLAACGAFIIYVILWDYKSEKKFDYIVVLTGDKGRVSRAFSLIEKHCPKSIFISGVYEKTNLRDVIPKGCSMENVDVVLGKLARNTRENAIEVDKWARKNNISEILLITSDYHMPRSLIEMWFVNNDLRIHPYIVKWDTPQIIKMSIVEFHKIICAIARHICGKQEA